MYRCWRPFQSSLFESRSSKPNSRKQNTRPMGSILCRFEVQYSCRDATRARAAKLGKMGGIRRKTSLLDMDKMSNCGCKALSRARSLLSLSLSLSLSLCLSVSLSLSLCLSVSVSLSLCLSVSLSLCLSVSLSLCLSVSLSLCLSLSLAPIHARCFVFQFQTRHAFRRIQLQCQVNTMCPESASGTLRLAGTYGVDGRTSRCICTATR